MALKKPFPCRAGLARCALALSLIGLAAPTWAQLTVTYVANEGFLLEGGGHKVLVDALFGEGISPYPAIPSALRPALEAGRPPFDDVDAVLVTHHHADHFDAETVARYLRASPRTRLVSTPQAVERLRRVVGGEPAVLERIEAVLPSEGQRSRLAHRGLRLEVLSLHHGRDRNPPVQNLGFLVEMGGVTWLHVGDTEVEERDVRPYALGDEAIDVAFLPTWFLGGGGWSRVVERQIRPATIVVMHRVVDGAPAAYYEPDRDAEGQLRRIRSRFPRVVVFTQAGDSRVFAIGEDRGRASAHGQE